MSPSPPPPTGYGLALAQTLLALAAVCALAWWLLRWSASRGLFTRAGRHVTVLDHTSLDARRSVWVVRVGAKVLVLGAGDQSLTLLTELRDDELTATTSKPLAERAS